MSVRVKDATKGLDLSYTKVNLGDTIADVSDLKEAVITKFKARWGEHAEDDVSLYLVAIDAGQDEPNEEQEKAAVASGPLKSTKSLEAVNVKRGCYLLAKCTGVADENAVTRPQAAGRDEARPLSPSVHSGMVSLHSYKAEADASTVFQVAHESFPAAALLDYQDRLLTQASRPISNRVFKAADFSSAFEAARQAYCAATLDPPKTAPKGGVDALDFSAGDYTRRDYKHVEFDCIVKVPVADNAEWSRDPADGESQRLFFIAPQSLQVLPERAAPVVPVASSGGEGQPSAGTRSAATSFSLEHYPPGSTHYIVGEVYSPLGEGDVKPFQKLLQAERNLQFLKAKAGATDIRTCVLGFIFMGPHMSAAMGAKLFNTLKHYQQVLPCLWELQGLQQHKPCRLLGCKVEQFQPAIAHLETSVAIRGMQDKLAGQQDKLAGQQDKLAAQLQEVNRKLDQRWCCIL